MTYEFGSFCGMMYGGLARDRKYRCEVLCYVVARLYMLPRSSLVTRDVTRAATNAPRGLSCVSGGVGVICHCVSFDFAVLDICVVACTARVRECVFHAMFLCRYM